MDEAADPVMTDGIGSTMWSREESGVVRVTSTAIVRRSDDGAEILKRRSRTVASRPSSCSMSHSASLSTGRRTALRGRSIGQDRRVSSASRIPMLLLYASQRRIC
jgi:hypothetical protein